MNVAQEIADYLKIPLSVADVRKFSDGEIFVEVKENVRGTDAFIIQSTCTPVNDNLMELVIMVDALRRASARRITAVVPYYGYARQDRKVAPRVPISAKVVAEMFMAVGVRRVLSMDLHAGQIQGFFDIPVDPLSAFPTFAEYFKLEGLAENAVIVSPDTGRAKLASRVSSILDIPMVMMHKRRVSFGTTEVTHVVGDVKDRMPIVIDDVIAGGSVIDSLPALLEAGARPEICVAITHPVLVGDSLKKLDAPYIQRVVVSNTIRLPPEKRHPKIEVVSIASVLAQVIQLVYEEKSITPVLSKLPGAR